MSVHKTGPDHKQLYLDLIQLLVKYSSDLTAEESLAVAANMIGKMIAMQDQRHMTPEQAMEIVRKNIELGNEQVLDLLKRSEGNA